MAAGVASYSLKGFIATLGFAAALTAVSGLVAFMSAPEAVVCSARTESVDCSLTRLLVGRVAVRKRLLRDVKSVELTTYVEDTGFSKPYNRRGTSHRLRFVTATGVAFSVHAGYSELDDVRGNVSDLLEQSGDLDELKVTIGGSPGAHSWALGFLAFGLALVPLWVLGYLFPGLRPRRRKASRK